MLALPQDKRLALLAGDALPPPLQQLAVRAEPAKDHQPDFPSRYRDDLSAVAAAVAPDEGGGAAGHRRAHYRYRAGAGFRQRQRLYLLFRTMTGMTPGRYFSPQTAP